jgi:exosortase/archaeosortase
MVFSWLVSADCYFSSRIYNATTAMAVAWIFLYIAVAVTVKSFSSSDDVARKRVAARYVVFVIYAPFVVFSLLSLLVFFTSRESVQVTTQISATGPGRSCRKFVDFYNEPTRRVLHVCHDKSLWIGKSGEFVVIDEKVGPLGVRILGIRRQT